MKDVNISFYLSPADYDRVSKLNNIEEFVLHHPQLVWVWTTYFRLKRNGCNIYLTDTLPKNGIVVISSIDLRILQRPSKEIFFISTVADSPPPFFSQINVSQNPFQAQHYPNLFKFPVWRHIPHWSQPGIVPRNPERGERFENIAFFGHRDQLEPWFLSETFIELMTSLQLKFEIKDRNFNDYSTIDAAIAIRDFSKEKYVNKPFTKLVNAWLANVPAIVGLESSFQSVQKSDLDFLLADCKENFLMSLKLLKDNPDLRKKMVSNGAKRATEFADEKIIQHWEKLLFHDAPRYHYEWTKKGRLGKNIFYSDLLISRSYRSAKKRFLKLVNG